MDEKTLHMKTVASLRLFCRENGIRVPAGSVKKQIVDLIVQYGKKLEEKDQRTEPKEETKAPPKEEILPLTNAAGSPIKADPAARVKEKKLPPENEKKEPVKPSSYPAAPASRTASGVLEIQPEGYGYLRKSNFLPGNGDTYISLAQIRRFNLKNGDFVEGKTRPQRDGDRYEGLVFIQSVNGETPVKLFSRPKFDSLTPVYPDKRIMLEKDEGTGDISLRFIDLAAPIGKGQRGLIVSPPKAGKTFLIKNIAKAVERNHPEIHLIVLLIDERPEEVTDLIRSVKGEVAYSTFDEAPENHTRLSEMTLERAKRLVESGKDVLILLDSVTRLSRAYNLVVPPSGRSLSGGLDPGALYKPKRFFGSARNIENGGSLTIIATALIETGSRMDDIIYEEFKGTGNMELHLDRKLSERRIFPAVDLLKSGTRRDELLLSKEEMECAQNVRRLIHSSTSPDTINQLISLMEKTRTNAEFVQKMKGWVSAWQKEGYHFGGS